MDRPKPVATLWELSTKCGHVTHIMIDGTEEQQAPSEEIISWYAARDCVECRSNKVTKLILRRTDV